MNLLKDIVTKHLPDWNLTVHGEAEALAFCAANDIYIVDDKKRKFGRLQFYTPDPKPLYDGTIEPPRTYTFLLINPNLKAGWREWVLWHEIGHFCLHAPESSNFSSVMKRKLDAEANQVAAVALMPRFLIETMTVGEIQDEFGYPIEVIRIRKDIYDKEKS